jgi:NAD(P)-dependent dehydrogenase (short-subunit alcohol dehydrogenase family)
VSDVAPLPRLSSQRLQGKNILVVGASVGIGRAACHRFAAEGAQVLAASRDLAACEETAARLAAAGASCTAVRIDVSEPESVKACFEQLDARFGRLDGAFNNAGIQTEPAPLAEHSEESWDRLFNVNLRGLWLVLREELPRLVAAGGGAIVNTSSVGGLVGAPGIGPYVSSKHGIVGLTKAAALDYAAAGIRVNAIAPGATRTAMFTDWLPTPEQQQEVAGAAPIARVAEPEEIVGAAAWLLSDDASFVTGITLAVDGGYSVP